MTGTKRKHMTVVAAPAAEDLWRASLVTGKNGAYQTGAHNIALVLDNDPALKGLFRLDEFANRIMISRMPPWTSGAPGEFGGHDAFELAAWIGRPDTYEMSYKPAQIAEAVEAIAWRRRFNSVRDYLGALVHDGEERIPKLFASYFGCEHSDYLAGIAKVFMIGAVARIYEPGCKVDHMLVFEGAQGAGKTSAVRALFGGDDWYVDAQRSPADKDFFQDIVGKWVVEIGEMTSFSKAETSKVKQTITAQSDTYRPSYGRYSKTFKRQCIFIGTTNEDSWQRDPTGGRRYLPVRVSAVDVAGIARDRDQLWAEAVTRYQQREPWWNVPALASDEQNQRYQDDSWTEPVLRWLCGKGRDSAYTELALRVRDKHGRVIECSLTEIMQHALHIAIGQQGTREQMRVGTIMVRLGWKKFRPERLGKRQWLWYAPDGWEWPDA